MAKVYGWKEERWSSRATDVVDEGAQSEMGDSHVSDLGDAWNNLRLDDPVLEGDETTEGGANKKRTKHWHDDTQGNGMSAEPADS